MSNVLIYDKETGIVKSYLKSVHTPDYADRDDVIINPEGDDFSNSIVEDGKVRKMTDEEIKANTPTPPEPTVSLTKEEILKVKQDLVDRNI